jgi:hypothetical protein
VRKRERVIYRKENEVRLGQGSRWEGGKAVGKRFEFGKRPGIVGAND